MPFGFNRQKTLDELSEENERAEVELSLAQKRAAIKRLKEANLTGKSFGWNWSAIRAWLRSH